jgi:hypothetical protein
MKKLAIAIALVAPAGCAQLKDTFNQPFAANGASALTDNGHPDWLRDPARGDFPYHPKGW